MQNFVKIVAYDSLQNVFKSDWVFRVQNQYHWKRWLTETVSESGPRTFLATKTNIIFISNVLKLRFSPFGYCFRTLYLAQNSGVKWVNSLSGIGVFSEKRGAGIYRNRNSVSGQGTCEWILSRIRKPVRGRTVGWICNLSANFLYRSWKHTVLLWLLSSEGTH